MINVVGYEIVCHCKRNHPHPITIKTITQVFLRAAEWLVSWWLGLGTIYRNTGFGEV